VSLRLAFVLAAAAALAACGDDHQAADAPQIDSAIDGPPQGATLTTFVIDLVQNKTADNTDPVAFDQFSTLPDPDGDNNNTAAYNPLFP
jgi:ABC-type glycerol-3-phosphate transport system substrate-binding protein